MLTCIINEYNIVQHWLNAMYLSFPFGEFYLPLLSGSTDSDDIPNELRPHRHVKLGIAHSQTSNLDSVRPLIAAYADTKKGLRANVLFLLEE